MGSIKCVEQERRCGKECGERATHGRLSESSDADDHAQEGGVTVGGEREQLDR